MTIEQDQLIKEEKDIPDPNQTAADPIEVKKEPESTEDQPMEENTTSIAEPDKEPTVETEVDKSGTAVKPEDVPKEDSAKVSVPAEVKPNPESETVASPEEEFRLPTPDPRFEVLPPVFKGTELSALCTIM